MILSESRIHRKAGIPLKVTLHLLESSEEEEVIIRYRKINGQIEEIVRIAEGSDEKIPCSRGEIKCRIAVGEVLYAESVDRATFLYTKDGVYRTAYSLQSLEAAYMERGFFRCAKSMLICIYRIAALKSETGGRIDATMENGEHVIISRKYARELRRELKGED